jgi:hypothetical protein
VAAMLTTWRDMRYIVSQIAARVQGLPGPVYCRGLSAGGRALLAMDPGSPLR